MVWQIFLPTAAHLLFMGHLLLLGMALGFIVPFIFGTLMFITRPWMAWLQQAVLLVYCAEWIRAGFAAVSRAASSGQSCLPALAGIAACLALTVLSIAIFRTERMRRLYRSEG